MAPVPPRPFRGAGHFWRFCPPSPGARFLLLNKTSRAISLPGRHLSEDREVNAMRPSRRKKHSSGDLKINVKLYNIKSFCWGKKKIKSLARPLDLAFGLLQQNRRKTKRGRRTVGSAPDTSQGPRFGITSPPIRPFPAMEGCEFLLLAFAR